jgi:Glycosyl hydrolase family 26
MAYRGSCFLSSHVVVAFLLAGSLAACGTTEVNEVQERPTGVGSTSGQGGSTGQGGATGGSMEEGTGGAGGEEPPCDDIAPPPNPGDPMQYTCEQQAGWGKCDESWMQGFCNISCRRCTPEPGDSSTSSTGSGSPPTCDQRPADPMASSRAAHLLCYLKTHQYVSGQTDLDDGDRVFNTTGRYPAMIAFDFYGHTDGNTGANEQNTQAAIDFALRKKGIVSFQWHWKAPRPEGRAEYYTEWDFPSVLENPSSQLYRDIDLIGAELKKINDAGVPVLFRPLHEANNNYMWWAKKGADAYKRLFRLMYSRITAMGAHGNLWVFNGMATGSGAATPMRDWNPGDDVVDIISGDYTQSQGDFDAMRGMGTSKVVGISETMNQLNPDSAPPFSFSVVWASRDWNGNSENDWRVAMAHPKTISLDQLPDMSAW